MSVSSNGSQMSVSFFGEEMDFDVMCDRCFKDLQSYMNDIHSKVRELSMVPEQDADYLRALSYHLEIKTGIEGITELLKELSSVSKQVLGKPPASQKEEVKKITDAHKLAKKMASMTTVKE